MGHKWPAIDLTTVRHRQRPYLAFARRVVESFPGAIDVLEVGPGRYPLVADSMRIDTDPLAPGAVAHDIGSLPWPLKLKRYDLALCLQVLEHLGDDARVADTFREMQKWSRMQLISLPWGWPHSLTPGHAGVSWDHVRRWTDGRPPRWTCLIPTPKMPEHPRIMLFYDSDN